MILMFSIYVTLIISFLFALFMPLSFLIASKLMRVKKEKNPIKNAPYESAEETIGGSLNIMNGYIGFFSIFLSFELITVILILWAYSSNYFSYTTSLLILFTLVLSMIFSLIAYKLSSGINE